MPPDRACLSPQVHRLAVAGWQCVRYVTLQPVASSSLLLLALVVSVMPFERGYPQ
jgi:hypothetical protein